MEGTDPKERRPREGALHLQIARDLRSQIESGRLRNGTALPSTRELAAEWSTSVHTISEAMRVLIDEGLVISQDRSKRIVNSPDQPLPAGERPKQPQVILVGGYPGSGKSELARILGRTTGWAIVDKDTITRPVVEAALEIMGLSPNDRESDIYFNQIRPREYEALNETVLEQIECGNSAIAAAPFIREFTDSAWLDRTTATLTAAGAHIHFVWVYCDADTMRRYMRRRGAARDASKLDDWPKWIASLDLDFRPAVPHTVIDNSESSLPLQTQARDLIDGIMRSTNQQ